MQLLHKLLMMAPKIRQKKISPSAIAEGIEDPRRARRPRKVSKRPATNPKTRSSRRMEHLRLRKSQSSSTDKRVSPRRQRLAAKAKLNQLVKPRRVMLKTNSHQRSRVEENVQKRLEARRQDTGLKALRPAKTEQAQRMELLARKVLRLVRKTLMENHQRRTTRKKRKKMMRKRKRRTLSTRIPWNSRRPRNSNPSGKNTGEATGEEAAARHMSRLKL